MKKVDRKKKEKKYLIPRIWQDSFSQGFIFAISNELILFFKKSELFTISR